ncbi:hypothetical protein [Natrinema sp. SYSU A 869]|uniref:hypothetical protein n=1 Tax=Natrinema sp. SYSU A 869 TaxID=2871694 RepID=UPI001CA3A1B3|nr:hypothetical protein [Natrinema sp. SYSU A 869]
MNRRPLLQTLATGGVLALAGCIESLPFAGDSPETSDVFEDYWYEETELAVRFRDDVDVKQAVLFNSDTDVEYETIERPGNTVRFSVVFPDRLETYLTHRPALRVKAETANGWARQSVWEPVHGAVRSVEPLADGRARFDIENQTPAPILARFVAIYGHVPNPTIDPQHDSFDRSSFDLGPGIVGVGANRPLSPSRTDLVVPPEETRPFETLYAPFAYRDGADAEGCLGDERTGTTALVHGSGLNASYGFTYRLEGEPTAPKGRESATVCSGVGSDAE